MSLPFMLETRPGKKYKVSISALEKGLTDKNLSYDDLKQYTNNFIEDNYIGKFQWGKVYHGYIGEQPVVVKKWEIASDFYCNPGEMEQRIRDEIKLLQHSTMSSHPNLVKLIGYCDACEEQLGVVYDVNLLDSLYNLISQDSFTWVQRIKVMIGFARVLEFMHAENLPHILRNISAAHILVDTEYNAKLFDFGMITGGIFPDRRYIRKKPYVNGCLGYINFDPWAPGYMSQRTDVFAFGVLLLMLISKRPAANEEKYDWDNPAIYCWAEEVYESCESETGSGPSKCLLVHESLQESEGFCASDGVKIELMALSCVGDDIDERPTMNGIVKDLLQLKAAAQLVENGMLLE